MAIKNIEKNENIVLIIITKIVINSLNNQILNQNTKIKSIS